MNTTQKEYPQSACDVSATSITAPANCQLAGHKAQLPEPTTGITSSNQKEILPPPSRANQAQPTNMTRQPQALSESSSGPPSRIVTQTGQTIQAAQNAQNPLTCDVSATFTTVKANSQLVNQKVEHTEPVTFTNSSNQKEIPEQTPPTNDTGPCHMTGQSLTTVVEEPSSAHRVVTQTSQTTLEEVDSSQFISDEEWRELRRRLRAVLREREQEDKEWREKRVTFRERLSALPLITAWLAILVYISNCTRQCLALPLFMVGPNVTSQMVVDALQAVLPKELQYLISDRGTHASAKVFAELAAIAGAELF